MAPSRRLLRAAHREADRSTVKFAAAAESPELVATVTTVTPGGAADGSALVSVTWRGVEVVVNGYPDSYTPAPGHRVYCSFVGPQLLIVFRIIGAP